MEQKEQEYSYILVEGISFSRNPSPHNFFFFPDIPSCYTVQADLELSILPLQPLTCWLGTPPPRFIMHIETQGFLEIWILTLPFSILIFTINIKFNTSWNSMFCSSSFSLNHHFDSRVKLVDTKTHDICKIPNCAFRKIINFEISILFAICESTTPPFHQVKRCNCE